MIMRKTNEGQIMKYLSIFLTWKKPTGNVVAEDARCDDSSKGSEEWFQFLLTHSFWEPWYVQICSFYGLRRWASERHLRIRFVSWHHRWTDSLPWSFYSAVGVRWVCWLPCPHPRVEHSLRIRIRGSGLEQKGWDLVHATIEWRERKKEWERKSGEWNIKEGRENVSREGKCLCRRIW